MTGRRPYQGCFQGQKPVKVLLLTAISFRRTVALQCSMESYTRCNAASGSRPWEGRVEFDAIVSVYDPSP